MPSPNYPLLCCPLQRSCRSSICPGHLSTAWPVCLVVFSCGMHVLQVVTREVHRLYKFYVKPSKIHLFFSRSCASCIQDIDCGYCFLDTGQQPANGSCLAVAHDHHGPVLNNGSATGRCEGDNPPDGLEWAYGYCPTNVAWIVTLGLVTYLAFFAPGM